MTTPKTAMPVNAAALEAATKAIYEDKGDRKGVLYVGWEDEPEDVKSQWRTDVKFSIESYLAALPQCDVQTRDDPSRDELIESIQYAIGTLSTHIEAYHDFDYQPHEVPPELAELRRLQHHLQGSLISSTGETASPVPSANRGTATTTGGTVAIREAALTIALPSTHRERE